MTDRGNRARLRLIEAAEQLFAERGIEAVSLRDISAAAGQRNHSAAQYHFVDRAGLVAAVFDHRMSEVNARRHRLLDEIDKSPGLDDSSEIVRLVEATVRPLIEVIAETAGWYGRFLARTRWDSFAQRALEDVPALSSYRRSLRSIAARLAATGPSPSGRLEQMGTLMIGTVAGWEWQMTDGVRAPSVHELCAELTTTCHAVLTAPRHNSCPHPSPMPWTVEPASLGVHQ